MPKEKTFKIPPPPPRIINYGKNSQIESQTTFQQKPNKLYQPYNPISFTHKCNLNIQALFSTLENELYINSKIACDRFEIKNIYTFINSHTSSQNQKIINQQEWTIFIGSNICFARNKKFQSFFTHSNNINIIHLIIQTFISHLQLEDKIKEFENKLQKCQRDIKSTKSKLYNTTRTLKNTENTIEPYKQQLYDLLDIKDNLIYKHSMDLKTIANLKHKLTYKTEKEGKLLDISKKDLPNSIYSDIYLTSHSISYENTSKVVEIICNTLKLDVKVKKKTQVSKIINSSIQQNTEKWNTMLNGQPCSIGFDIATQETFPNLIIVYKFPINKKYPQVLNQIENYQQKGYSFGHVKEWEHTELHYHTSNLIKLNHKNGKIVADAVSEEIDKTQVLPLWFNVDGGSENTGNINGALAILKSMGFTTFAIICSAHKLHNTFEHACKWLPKNTCKTIDWIIRYIRNNWKMIHVYNIKKPALALSSRWLTYIKGAMWVLEHKIQIKSLIKSLEEKGKKAKRAKTTLEMNEFWVNCHILAGFGDLFFIPAYTWIQVDQGRRAPLMLQQISKWSVLLTHISNNPREYFATTFSIAEKLSVCTATIEESIKNFAKEANTRILEYFKPWLRPPLTLATINDHESAKVLLTDIIENPKAYDLHGFLSKEILSEFITYANSENSNINNYVDLNQWFVSVFGSCCVHNVDNERAFCLMRYLRTSKYLANNNLISGLIETSIQKNIPKHIDFITGLILDTKLDDDELQEMLTDIITSSTVKDSEIIIDNSQLIQSNGISQNNATQNIQPELISNSEVQSTTTNSVNPFDLLKSAIYVLMSGIHQTVQAIANKLISYKKQFILNECLDTTFPTNKLHPFETLVSCACV